MDGDVMQLVEALEAQTPHKWQTATSHWNHLTETVTCVFDGRAKFGVRAAIVDGAIKMASLYSLEFAVRCQDVMPQLVEQLLHCAQLAPPPMPLQLRVELVGWSMKRDGSLGRHTGGATRIVVGGWPDAATVPAHALTRGAAVLMLQGYVTLRRAHVSLVATKMIIVAAPSLMRALLDTPTRALVGAPTATTEPTETTAHINPLEDASTQEDPA